MADGSASSQMGAAKPERLKAVTATDTCGRIPLKIATYNVNGVNGRLPRLLEWLTETAPDIACLQEVKTDDSKFPAGPLKDAGYGAIWHGQRSFHGVAVLANGEVPREIRRGLPGDDTDSQTRYLEAE